VFLVEELSRRDGKRCLHDVCSTGGLLQYKERKLSQTCTNPKKEERTFHLFGSHPRVGLVLPRISRVLLTYSTQKLVHSLCCTYQFPKILNTSVASGSDLLHRR
jgi:hypothetical protein